jgi:hypothetical protein
MAEANAGKRNVLIGASGKLANEAASKVIKKASLTYRKPTKKYTGSKLSLAGFNPNFTRADLKFDGVDHSEVSYEARVFFNNPKANETTPMTLDNGYAGRFHIFGHGGCFGDVGHCESRGQRRAYDPRPGHPLTPACKTIIATEAIRHALKNYKEVTITVVPIVLSGTKLCDYENVMRFEKVEIVTYV